LMYWGDLSAFPSPVTLDLLYDWGARYVLVDENLYRAGSSSWNIYQTWETLTSAIKATPRLKELVVLDGVHVYQLGIGTREGNTELLTNGSFEEGNTTSAIGWETVGNTSLDRTGKFSAGGRTACLVTAKDFLLSRPVPVEGG